MALRAGLFFIGHACRAYRHAKRNQGCVEHFLLRRTGLYTYSLRQGIDDGFLAPYKVVQIDIDKDVQGWRPSNGQVDKHGQLIEDRVYNQIDMDRTLILEKRTELVARKITEFLIATDPYAKTIVFCDDIDHAERMRQALINLNPERVRESRKYIMRITGDEQEGKAELDNFINPEERYPVIATTSKLMTTGVDAQTCKLVVLNQHIKSMTEFKQMIGRGTRINEDYGKFWFTIMDFKKVTELFADKDFDGDPVARVGILAWFYNDSRVNVFPVFVVKMFLIRAYYE